MDDTRDQVLPAGLQGRQYRRSPPQTHAIPDHDRMEPEKSQTVTAGVSLAPGDVTTWEGWDQIYAGTVIGCRRIDWLRVPSREKVI